MKRSKALPKGLPANARFGAAATGQRPCRQNYRITAGAGPGRDG